MLTSSLSQVVDALDELRRSPKYIYIYKIEIIDKLFSNINIFGFGFFFVNRKFNCINDNMDGNKETDDNQLIIGLLEDFYLSLFPIKSEYELPDNYRNSFRNINEYRQWQLQKYQLITIIYLFCIIVFVIGIKLLTIRKHRRRIIGKFIVINCIICF